MQLGKRIQVEHLVRLIERQITVALLGFVFSADCPPFRV